MATSATSTFLTLPADLPVSFMNAKCVLLRDWRGAFAFAATSALLELVHDVMEGGSQHA
jgi:hypothetical protein